MGRLSAAVARTATEIGRQNCRDKDASVCDVLTEIAKRVLWIENTAPCLAVAVQANGGKCSVRQAERYLGGECEYSGDAVAAIMSEIFKRRGLRNLKVRARE